MGRGRGKGVCYGVVFEDVCASFGEDGGRGGGGGEGRGGGG